MLKAASLGAPLAVLGGWSAYVSYERSRPPANIFARKDAQDRRSFYVGSTNDMISDGLQTGDVVVFSRDCFLMQPCASALCYASKLAWESSYDHCGIVHIDRLGRPHVLEATHSGVMLAAAPTYLGTARRANQKQFFDSTLCM